MRASDYRAMDHAPVICVEQASLVLQWLVQHWSIDRYACVVHPRVKPAEMPDRFVRDVLHVMKLTDVANDVDCFAARCIDLIRDLLQRCQVARIEHHTRAALRRHPRRHKSNTGRGTRNNNHLVRQILEAKIHTDLLGSYRSPALNVEVETRATSLPQIIAQMFRFFGSVEAAAVLLSYAARNYTREMYLSAYATTSAHFLFSCRRLKDLK